MENTPNLHLPHIMPSQAQKHVTHNEALDALDAVVQLAVIDRNLTAPPGDPAEGDRHIVGDSATDAWAGHDGKVAAFQDGLWAFYQPRDGWLAWVIDEARLCYWTGSAWADVADAIAALQNLALLGVGTTADATNPFSAKLNKALWTAKTVAEGGDGDLRYTMNKESAADVLSLLLQTNWSGRAEIGLVGDDQLTIKVSPDGSDWKEALRADGQTGRLSFPNTNLLSDYAVSLLPDSGRFAGNAAKTNTVGAFSLPAYFTLYNSSTAGDAGKFISDNNDYGGTQGTLPATVKDLIDGIRSPAHRRHGVEFRVAEITMGSGTASTPINVESTNYYLSALPSFGPMVPAMTFHAYIRAIDAPVLWSRQAGQTLIVDGVDGTEHALIAPADGWVSVTVQHLTDPYLSVGYQPNLWSIYAAASGHRYQLACLALMGGITRVDDNIGVIAGINRWLP